MSKAEVVKASESSHRASHVAPECVVCGKPVGLNSKGRWRVTCSDVFRFEWYRRQVILRGLREYDRANESDEY